MNLLIAMFFLFFSSFSFAAILKNIVVFGDSLSDNGNLYKQNEGEYPSSPPYYDGRFSNGAVWVEQLSEILFPNEGASHLQDFAYGGAMVGKAGGIATVTLKYEIDTYLQAHRDRADPSSLFVIWIGANNYFALPENALQSVFQVNLGISQQLKRLVRSGAMHILVLNLPDLGRIPIARTLEIEKELSDFTSWHNRVLEYSLLMLKADNPKVHWLYFDTKKSVDEALEMPEKFGFINVFDYCRDLDHLTIKKDSLHLDPLQRVIQQAKLKSTHADACEGYLFFDEVHATVFGHRLLANQIHELLENEGISFG